MRCTVVTRNMNLSARLRSHLEERAQFALSRFAAALTGVRVSLADENGPRGGVDKRCQVLLNLRRGEPIVVAGRGTGVEALVERTLERAARTLSRTLKRLTARRTTHPRGEPK